MEANCVDSNIYFHKEIMILTPKTVDKWPPQNYFEMMDL